VYPCRDDAIPRRKIAVRESKRGDGTFPDSSCSVSGHQKSVETAEQLKQKVLGEMKAQIGEELKREFLGTGGESIGSTI
jgi:hypothetical protein